VILQKYYKSDDEESDDEKIDEKRIKRINDILKKDLGYLNPIFLKLKRS